METNVWFVPNEKSYIWYVPGAKADPPSPRLEYPAWYFDWFYNHYCSSEEFFINLFKEHATMAVDYYDMVSNWEYTIRSIQDHLGVDPIDIPMMFNKRTHGTIKELISNHDEIRISYANHPILAHYFAVASQLPRQQRSQLEGNNMNSTNLVDATVVITTCEVNLSHGTGALVKRIVANTPNVLSIRSMDLYGGDHDLGDVSLCISHKGLSRQEAIQKVISALGRHTISKVLCVPYISDDLITAITLHDLYQVPLATHIMDDQNICVNNIPDELMQEFLSKCSLRLVTHPELRDAYEAKYGQKFWLLPSVVSEQLISTSLKPSELNSHSPNVGVLIGSFEDQQLFELLCTTVNDAEVKLDWYNGSVDRYGKTQYFWLQDNPEKAKELGITPCGFLPEEKLAETLRGYSYLVAPTGALDGRDDNPRFWRIIFALATANIPVIILGSGKTSAARFVQKFNIGVTCDYDGESLRQAIDQIADVNTQQQMRQNAASIASKFSAKGINQWLWESISLSEPSDLRFEELLPISPEQSRMSSTDEPLKGKMTNGMCQQK
jgi:glutamate-1-semialdehyde 2,1-aminomutase